MPFSVVMRWNSNLACDLRSFVTGRTIGTKNKIGSWCMGRYRKLGPFAGAFVVGSLVTALVRWPPAQSSDWAAWVQAIGSILAIWAAFSISDREARATRESAKEESAAALKQRRMTVVELMEHAARLCYELRKRGVNNTPEYRDESAYRSASFSYALKSLESIDLISLESSPLVRGVVGVLSEASSAQQLADQYFRQRRAELREPIKSHCEAAERHYALAVYGIGLIPVEQLTPFLPEEEFADRDEQS